MPACRWWSALLLGTIVATTDPAAVVAIFRELGAPPRLTRLLEGESLLNDAAAIVLFGVIVVDLLTDGAHPASAPGSCALPRPFSAGWLLGAVAGRLFGADPAAARRSRSAEVTLSVALPYIVYLVGEEVFDVSGVVAVVSAGLTAGAIGRVRLPAGQLALPRAGLGADRFLGRVR